jgi:hypothetical protein
MNARFTFPADGLAAKPKKGRRRKAVNWLHVNIGAREANEMRALAECLGMEFRTFLEVAVRSYWRERGAEIEREFGVKYWNLAETSRARRVKIGKARGEMRQACGVSFPERN